MASIMVAAGRSRRDAVLAATFLGTVTVVGTLGTTLLQGSVRIALPVSAGAATGSKMQTERVLYLAPDLAPSRTVKIQPIVRSGSTGLAATFRF